MKLYFLPTCCVLLVVSGFLLGISMVDAAERKRSVTADNCRTSNVYLPENSVSHLPHYYYNPNQVQIKERTSLQYALNTAVSRAMFFSMIYRWTNTFSDFRAQPGQNYLYTTTAANVLAGPSGVTSSGLFYARNASYPNWIRDVSFNRTLPLFAVRATRETGSKDVNVKDLGASPDTDYSDRRVYRQNQFLDGLGIIAERYRMAEFTFRLHSPNGSSTEMSFYQDDADGFGRMQLPYYDCGQSNRWLVPAVSQVVELMPRYVWWRHLQHYRTVATSTVSTLYDTVDTNLCPSSDGPSLPDCPLAPRLTREKFLRGQEELAKANPSTCNRSSAATPMVLASEFWNVTELKVIFEVQGRAALRLAHGLSNFLQNNDPSALERNEAYLQRLWEEHMNSATSYQEFMNMPEPVPDSPMRLVNPDVDLTKKWIQSEAYSTLMADGQLMSVGIYFDTGKFPSSQSPVSSFAWKDNSDLSGMDSSAHSYTANLADLYELGEDFTSQDWFVSAKTKYASSSYQREFRLFNEIRTSLGSNQTEALPHPVTYVSVDYEDGHWISPHFRCDQRQAHWTASYLVPIYTKIDDVEFAGVVKVDTIFTAAHVAA